MKKAEIYKLMDLIEDVKKLDELITLHRQIDPSDFMIAQYEAKMTKSVGALIDELASPVQSTDSYLLIKKILNKYYPFTPEEELIADTDIGKLAAVT